VDLVDLFAVEEDPFRQRRLPGIDMGADPDIPHFGDICLHRYQHLSNERM
jgi:hypothetical protein